MKYIDMHCDTLMQALVRGKEQIFTMPEAMADIERLRKGEAAAQFFAIFLPPAGAEKLVGRALPGDDEYIQMLSGILDTTIRDNQQFIGIAHNARDLDENGKQGKLSAFLTIEDGRSIDGSLEKLQVYYDLGVRLISLTWNAPNCLGFPNSREADVMGKGLTAFGKDAVRRMEELGMLIDVSHLSDGGFYDVADICRGPFVASHSNCRTLCPHPRNLTDDMIRIVGDKGGVIGVNFGPQFLEQKKDGNTSRIEAILAHINHLIQTGGEDCAALGTDFDGIQGEFEVGSPDKMQLLFEAMEKKGMTGSQIEKVAYKNVERVIRDVM